MKRTSLVSFLLAVAVTTTADGGVVLDITAPESLDTLPGFSIFVLRLETDMPGETITSVEGDFRVDPPHTLHQVNPFGSQTIFQDNNFLFPIANEDVRLDSQFLFDTANDSLLIARQSESPTNLTASFTGFAPFAARDIAQVVLPDGVFGTVNVGAVVDVVGVRTEINLPTQVIGIPEPNSLAMVGLVACLSLCYLWARNKSENISWGNASSLKTLDPLHSTPFVDVTHTK